MTNQELYNISRKHLLTQKVRAFGPRKIGLSPRMVEGCLYRGPNGTKCAIGIHIPDEKYDSQFEGEGLRSRRVREAAGIDDTIPDQMAIGERLQSIHDNVDPTEWLDALDGVARRFGLEIVADAPSNDLP